VNRRELVNALTERLDSDRRHTEHVLSTLTDLITEKVSKGEPVAISGFAKFARVDRAARMGRNPQTGEAIQIKASRRVRITPLKAFKDAVLTGKGPAKKAPAKKAPAKKAPATKAASKSAAAKKATRPTTAKKATARSAAATRAPAKKRAAKKTAVRTTTATRKAARR
jgi:DNA-binding protein HU-beta